MSDKCPICKSSVIIETLILNEEELQCDTDTDTDTSDEPSDDSSDKCDVTFYHWQTLQKE